MSGMFSVHHYSPFSMRTVNEEQNRALLLQFILSELFNAKDASEKKDPIELVFSSPACFFPYDWSYEVGCLNKIHEHATLLEYAFPEFEHQTEKFCDHVDKILSFVMHHKKKNIELENGQLLAFFKELYVLLQPFLLACRENEGLLLFLLKNNNEIGEIAFPETLSSLLHAMFPEGLKRLASILRSKYQSRGFTALLAEIDRLLEPYGS